MNEPSVDFTGKYLWLQMAGDLMGIGSITVENARLEEQGGRTFLVAKITAGKEMDQWGDGTLVNVAWDRVETYWVYESLEALVEALEESNRHPRQMFCQPVQRPSFLRRLFGLK